MEWTTDAPTKPGTYWIFTVPIDEQCPEIYCVSVSLWTSGELDFDLLCGGWECEPEISVERTTHWMGPLIEPEAPKGGL